MPELTEVLCSAYPGGTRSVPYCGENEGGCALHYPSDYEGRHAHEYRAVYDNLGQSRALCIGDKTRTLCEIPYCPRHGAGAYTDYRARHATDSLR